MIGTIISNEIYEIFQSQSMSGKGNVISIVTPWKTICSEESAMAGLILTDGIFKQFGGNVGAPFIVTIQNDKNSSTKRKRTEDR